MTTSLPTTVADGERFILPAHPGHLGLDTNHTSVGFAIRRLGLAKVKGHFGDVSAEP